MKNKFLIGFVIFGLIFGFFGEAKIIRAESNFTANMGEVVRLLMNEEAQISLTLGRSAFVKLTGYEGDLNRNVFHYKLVDNSGSVLEERDVHYGPNDSAGEIEVLKSSSVNALITIPASSVWVGSITPPLPQPVPAPAPTPIATPVAETMTLTLNTAAVASDIETEFNLTAIGDNYADIEMNYSARNTYQGLHWDPGNTTWRPGDAVSYPEYYSGNNLLDAAQHVYRKHYSCDGVQENFAPEHASQQALYIDPNFMTDWVGKPWQEILELAGGYGNFQCQSRYKEQCILDGSYDKYYDERCDYGRVRFTVGETKTSPAFNIQLTKIIDSSRVEIAITDRGRTEQVNPKTTLLMRIKGQAGIYAVDPARKIKRAISDKAVFDSYNFSFAKVQEVAKQEIDRYQNAEPVGLKEGALVKAASQSKIYVVKEGILKLIDSPSVLKKEGYKWKDVKTVPEKVINMQYVGDVLK